MVITFVAGALFALAVSTGVKLYREGQRDLNRIIVSRNHGEL